MAAAAALLPGGPVNAASDAPCAQDRLDVRGTAVSTSYCVTGPAKRGEGSEVTLTVSETFSATGGTLSRKAGLSFLAGNGPSRTIETVPLDKLGIEGQLHLTLVYDGSTIRIESALLTPGAITIR